MADGTVIVIGGAEDKFRDRVILQRFVALAGGPRAEIAVISTASSLGVEAAERYREVFGDLGVRRVHPIHATTRAEADDEAAVALIGASSGVFLTGGNQLKRRRARRGWRRRLRLGPAGGAPHARSYRGLGLPAVARQRDPVQRRHAVRGGWGRVELPGGSAEQMIDSIGRLAGFEDGLQVLPGHGPSTTIRSERPWMELVVEGGRLLV